MFALSGRNQVNVAPQKKNPNYNFVIEYKVEFKYQGSITL